MAPVAVRIVQEMAPGVVMGSRTTTWHGAVAFDRCTVKRTGVAMGSRRTHYSV